MISVVVAARDEERRIGACLASVVGWADEVVVVDDHSSDRTAELAEQSGARVIRLAQRSFDGDELRGRPDLVFREGFLSVRGEWILRMDCDERPSEGLKARLRQVAAEDRYAGVRFARRYYYFGDWLRHGGWFRSEQLGFFRADAWDRSWPTAIHQHVPVRGEVLELPAVEDLSMAHLEYDDVAQFVTRALLSYARADGQARARAGGPGRRPSLFARPARRSLGRYVVRGGYRDGARGAVAAALLGAYEVCAEAFAWEAGRSAVRGHGGSGRAGHGQDIASS